VKIFVPVDQSVGYDELEDSLNKNVSPDETNP